MILFDMFLGIFQVLVTCSLQSLPRNCQKLVSAILEDGVKSFTSIPGASAEIHLSDSNFVQERCLGWMVRADIYIKLWAGVLMFLTFRDVFLLQKHLGANKSQELRRLSSCQRIHKAFVLPDMFL